jgi:hypothetical protein
MKRIVRILWIGLFAVTLGFAGKTNLTLTIDGITYNNVRFVHPTPATVTIFHSTGVATIPLAKLPSDLQKQFNYDPQAAAQWTAAQQKADAEAAEARRTAAEEQRKSAAAAAEEQRKAAATVQWALRVQTVLPDGVIGWGCQGATRQCTNSISILLVNPPRLGELAEGDEITATAYRDGVAEAQTRTLEKWVYYEPTSQPASRTWPPPPPPAVHETTREKPQNVSGSADMHFPELPNTGAFGFPQNQSTVFCNRRTLRFSVWNNAQYLFAQAVLWMDDGSSVTQDASGDAVGDYSELMLDLDDDGKVTPNVDRVYRLNQRPYLPGLRYAIWRENGGTSGDRNDSQGRGAIRYVDAAMGQPVRVDTYLIPLPEISKHVGDKIGICYFAYSPKSHLRVNSVTFDTYITRNKYNQYVLTKGGAIDIDKVPEGRDDQPVTQ